MLLLGSLRGMRGWESQLAVSCVLMPVLFVSSKLKTKVRRSKHDDFHKSMDRNRCKARVENHVHTQQTTATTTQERERLDPGLCPVLKVTANIVLTQPGTDISRSYLPS